RYGRAPTLRQQPSIQHSSGIHVESMSVNTGPMHARWDIPLDGLPKIARLQPIKPQRWPWVFLGLLAGAAAAVFFWLPRLDTQSLPPEVASVVAPLQAALTQSTSQTPRSQAATPAEPNAKGAEPETHATQSSEVSPGTEAPRASEAGS